LFAAQKEHDGCTFDVLGDEKLARAGLCHLSLFSVRGIQGLPGRLAFYGINPAGAFNLEERQGHPINSGGRFRFPVKGERKPDHGLVSS
jgi:hypothetical protein